MRCVFLEWNVIKIVEIILLGTAFLLLWCLLPSATTLLVATRLPWLIVTTTATSSFFTACQHLEAIAIHFDAGSFGAVLAGISPNLQLPVDKYLVTTSQILVGDLGVSPEAIHAIPIGFVDLVSIRSPPASIYCHREIDNRVSGWQIAHFRILTQITDKHDSAVTS